MAQILAKDLKPGDRCVVDGQTYYTVMGEPRPSTVSNAVLVRVQYTDMGSGYRTWMRDTVVPNIVRD